MNPRKHISRRAMLLFIPVFILLATSSHLLASGSFPLESLFGSRDAAILLDPKGRIIFQKNADQSLIPASTLKILSSLVALHYLGSDYHWVTEFYIDSSTNLKVKGYGDPLLTSEVLTAIADRLAPSLQTEFVEIKNLFLDTTFFSPSLAIPGVSPSSEPYDAPNGALVANFNTVFFTRDAQGNYISAEPQTPLTAYALDRIRATGAPSGRILLSTNGNEAAVYTGHLIRHFLAGKDLEISGSIRTGKVDRGKDRLIYTHNSRYPLEEVVSQLLAFSNNYVANQLLISTGAKVYGPPGTLEKGLGAMVNYTENRLGMERINIVEGSGIARENRITPRQMAKVLEAFQPYHHLLRKKDREFYKTGTLQGIRTRAGYLEDGKGELYRFAVFINTPGSSINAIMAGIRKLASP